MAYLEEIMPEVRKGRKARRKAWDGCFYIKAHQNSIFLFRYFQENEYTDTFKADSQDILANDWELVPEPKKYSTKVYLWNDGVATTSDERYGYMAVPRSSKVIETREIEWEVKE